MKSLAAFPLTPVRQPSPFPLCNIAQPRPPVDPQLVATRNATEEKLEAVAIVERKVMVSMSDGKRMAADVYRPKDTSKKYPTIFVRTPYNFNYWDVRNGVPRDMTSELEAVKRGYAYVEMNERGHFFSEGAYDILGAPLSDGSDAITWMTSQPWSDGKVGTIGCSSTAEWQLGVAALGNPGFTTMIPQGFGAGVGRVGPYYEQGNWYRGGAVQMLFIAWLYGEQNARSVRCSRPTLRRRIWSAPHRGCSISRRRCHRSIGRRH